MAKFLKSIKAWQTSAFSKTLTDEIHQLDLDELPLQQSLTFGNYASKDSLKVMILSTNDDKNKILIKTGIFFTGIITGCHCADDPTPGNEHNEYCELMIEINKNTADSIITLLS